MTMTPRQKWAALADPKTVEDYGVSVSESEMRTFPEGRAFLLAIRKCQRDAKWIGRRMAECGAQAAATVDHVALDVLANKPDHRQEEADGNGS